MLSYAYPASDVRTLTSNLGGVRMPVLGIPELRTMGVRSHSMRDNARRSFPLHRLDVAATTPR